MKKILLLVMLPLISAPAEPTLARLSFMAGCWAGEDASTKWEEMWMQPRAGSMMGMSRTTAGQKTVATEYMHITEQDGVLVMSVQLRLAQGLTPFRLSELTGRSAVFSNPEHDFPQRIIYRVAGDDKLLGRIEGTSQGKEKAHDFPMKRTRCD
jgi:hypothetical protein